MEIFQVHEINGDDLEEDSRKGKRLAFNMELAPTWHFGAIVPWYY